LGTAPTLRVIFNFRRNTKKRGIKVRFWRCEAAGLSARSSGQ
jgi:hypothetical protein